jgi:reactive intermediate/imine deaminase
MANTPIIPEGLGRPGSPLVPGYRAGNTIYVSGQLPLGGNGELVGRGDVGAQTSQVLENVRKIVEAGGGQLTDIVKCNVYLANMAHFQEMNKAYAAFFGEHRPARATVESRLAGPDYFVEIEATAVLSAE